MNGIYKQIQESSTILTDATEDDFISLMNDLTNRDGNEESKPLVFITGVGGYLKMMFKWYGKRKLPRKIKKRIYLTKKLRKIHIPEYYK